jgi:hypothetical protein
MTEAATPAQLVDAYVDRLRQSLSSAEPVDRAEIVDAVREHLRDALDALGHEPSAAEVEAALRELGPVEGVARAWAEGAGLPRPVAEEGSWGRRVLAVLTVVLAVVSVLAIVANPLLVALPLQLCVLVAALVGARRDAVHRALYRAAAGTAGVGAVLSLVVVLMLFSAGGGTVVPDEPLPGEPAAVQTP